MRFFQCIRSGIINVRCNMLVIWLPWMVTVGVEWLAGWVVAAVPDPAAAGSAVARLQRILDYGAWLPAAELGADFGFPIIPSENPASLTGSALLLFRIFLDAAVIVFLSTPVLDRRLRRFLPSSTVYAGRFFRLLLTTLTLAFCLTWLAALFSPRLANWDSSGWKASAGTNPFDSWALAALLFAVQVVASYARVQTVLEERTSMLLTCLSAVRFVLQHFGEVLGIALIQLAPAVLMVSLPAYHSSRPWQLIVIGVMLYGCAWIANWLRAVSYAAQIELVRGAPEAKGVTLFRPEA